jgi:ligand-binding sensor domain-containing protein
MERTTRRRLWWGAGAGLLAASLAGGFIVWKASQALKTSKQALRAEREIHFIQRPFRPIQNPGFETVRAAEAFVQAARFRDGLYVAGSAGLAKYDLRGTLVREFFCGQDLPASRLVALAVGQIGDSIEPELILATADQGILIYDGKKFGQVYPKSPEVRAITTILPAGNGHLLIGTKRRGVLLYDGKTIRELHPTLGNLYVQAMAGTEVDLWVGTLDKGVKHWHAGTTEAFGQTEGLPDKQVQAIALRGDRAYVGTPLGVAEFQDGRFERILGAGVLATALYVSNDELWIGSMDQGVIRVPLASKRPARISARDNAQPEKTQEVRQLIGTDGGALVLTRDGIYQLKNAGLGWKEVLASRPATLSDANVSALAIDKNGQLWVGYFDRGLDILPAGNGHVLHVEDDHVFCVNRIWPNANGQTVEVATANGLVRFSPGGKLMQVLGHGDGLIAGHVTDVAPYQNGLAIATPTGITFLDSDGPRSMYAFHGLVNNHVYALGASSDELLVGTLGGLSDLKKGMVKTNYRAGSSGLKQNWITAVVRVDDEWMVGTYGSGVVALDDSGKFASFEKATGEIEINPNAMLVTKEHVFAGTLGNGLLVYDREKRRWNFFTDGLPSANVTALAADAGYVYIGTDNGLVRIEEKKLQP